MIKILYAEDDPSTQEIVKLLIKKIDGVEVVFANDGKEALELYKKNPFDLVATDVYMPNMDGFELIHEIKKLDPTQIFMMVTGMQDKEDLIKAIGLRVNLFLKKPINRKEFIDTFLLAIKIIGNKKEHIRLKNQLEDELDFRLKLIQQQEQMILHQSKLAAMGEMLDAVAHQWKQPLGIIKMKADFLQTINQDEVVEQNEIDELMHGIISQVNHLAETLTEFRNFFRPVQNLKKVKIGKLLDSVLILLKDELIKNKIEVKLQGALLCEVYILPNEFKHLLINLINNSKDAYNDNEVCAPKEIVINIQEEAQNVVMSVQDKAGGIPENIIEHIFEPNSTTKEYGTGIGLYMTKQIIHKINGSIDVENLDGGARFTIQLPKKEPHFV